MNKCTNEADSSAYEGVEVATGSVDVSLGPSTTIPPRQTAEQDGSSNHYLRAQYTTEHHRFSVVPSEDRTYVTALRHLEINFCTRCHFPGRSATFALLIWEPLEISDLYTVTLSQATNHVSNSGWLCWLRLSVLGFIKQKTIKMLSWQRVCTTSFGIGTFYFDWQTPTCQSKKKK